MKQYKLFRIKMNWKKKIYIIKVIILLFSFSAFAQNDATAPRTTLSTLSYEGRPKTPEEAIKRMKLYADTGEVPYSPLHKKVTVNFYVTTKDNMGWYNELTQDNGFYGKVMPPLVLADGRSLVPVIGNFYGVSEDSFHLKGEMVDITIKELTDEELSTRLGFERVRVDGVPVTVDFHTFGDVVGRLSFLYGDGGYVESVDDRGIVRTIDSSESFLDSLIAGNEFGFVGSRLDFKALGTTQTKYCSLGGKFLLNNERVFYENESYPYRVFVESYGERREIKDPSIIHGIVLDSKYQEGFPSPSGAEVKKFPEIAIKSIPFLRKVGGEPTDHIVSQVNLGLKLKGTVRFTPNSLRINEALEEYKLDEERSFLGRLEKQGRLQDHFEELFENIGRNQCSLLLSGKTLIQMGGNVLHITTPTEKITMEATYEFFTKNIDIIGGKTADLGDYFSFADSLNDEDMKESIAIMVDLIKRFIQELEEKGLIEKSEELRTKLLSKFAEGFTGRRQRQLDLTEIFYGELSYFMSSRLKEAQMHEGMDSHYDELDRHKLSDGFEEFVDTLYGTIKPYMEYWPRLPYGYDMNGERTLFRRFSPWEMLSGEDVSDISRNIEALRSEWRYIAEDVPFLKINLIFPEEGESITVAEALGLEDYFSAVIGIPPTDNTELGEHKTIAMLRKCSGKEEVDDSIFSNTLEQAIGTIVPEDKISRDFLGLVLAVHEAFMNQSNDVYFAGEVITLEEALMQINKLRKQLDVSQDRDETLVAV